MFKELLNVQVQRNSRSTVVVNAWFPKNIPKIFERVNLNAQKPGLLSKLRYQNFLIKR